MNNKPGRPTVTILPPLPMLRGWREQGLSPQEVYQKCAEFCQARNRNGNSSRAEQLWALYRNHSAAEAGRRVGISTNRVYQILHRAGYGTRLHLGRKGTGNG